MSFLKIKGRTVTIQLLAEQIINELWCWWEFLFRPWPGRIGRGIRFLAYRLFFPHATGLFLIPEYVHIWRPWRLTCGKNVRFGRFSQINCEGNISIGDNVMMGPFVVIVTTKHIFKDSNILIRNQGLDTQPIVIENDIWIGAHSTILPGVTIGEGSIIAAGSVVTKDVPSKTVVAGIPARPIMNRQ